MVYKLALGGLTVRDQRLIEVVLARVSNPKYRFEVSTDRTDRDIDILVTDAAIAQTDAAQSRLKALNPNAVEVCLADPGAKSAAPYRLDRRLLMIQIRPLLHEVIESEGLIGAPVESEPRDGHAQ